MASIRKLNDGRWQAQFRPVPGGKQITRTTRRRVDAQTWLDEQTASVVTGTFADPRGGRVSFSAFYADWSTRQVWAPGTRRAMDLAANSVPFGDVPLRLIRRSHVEQWVKTMTTRPLAAGTIHTRANNVRAVLRGAVNDRLIPSDPSAGVTLPRRRRSQAAMTVPTSEQVGKLLNAADEGFRPFVALCAFAGLRLGEAAAVQVGDIDFLRRQLAVSRQVQRENGGGVEIRPPKYGSERAVHLPDALVGMLSEHVRTRRPGTDPARWLFLGERDLPPHQNTVGYWWRRAREAADTPRLRLHDLRHYYASGLIAAGCDVVTVQRALGHSSATTTLNTYSHLWPSAEDRTRAAATSMLTEAMRAADERLTNRPEASLR